MDRIADLYQERADIAAQIAEQEERITKAQEQQNQLAFLKQQMDLLAFVKEQGLNPADIFAGFEFGLNASIPDLVDAMSNAMQQIIDAANNSLGIASPSKVFKEVGNYVMQGFASGINAAAALPQRTFDSAVDQMVRSNTVNRTDNFYINNPAQMAVYLQQQETTRLFEVAKIAM